MKIEGAICRMLSLDKEKRFFMAHMQEDRLEKIVTSIYVFINARSITTIISNWRQ
ncbi:hypothetical protein [Thermococcus alcaliphilus]|uniref:hypothetical protein n=1 Tax=Thermococcus alcaliphilus TaxID=139207 RepID=UPI003EBB26FA